MARAKPSSAAKKSQAAQQSGGGGSGHAAPSRLARYLDPEAPWDKDQLLDAVHWIRQAVGLACGLLWGAVPLVGAAWIVLFVAISSGIIYWYYAHLLKVDEEEFGGHGALLQEGMFASFTLFLIWPCRPPKTEMILPITAISKSVQYSPFSVLPMEDWRLPAAGPPCVGPGVVSAEDF